MREIALGFLPIQFRFTEKGREMRTIILTGESCVTHNKVRFGMRFIGSDSKALNIMLSYIPIEYTELDYTIRFTDSNRNLRNIEWLFDTEMVA